MNVFWHRAQISTKYCVFQERKCKWFDWFHLSFFRRDKFKPRWRSIIETSISPWSPDTQSYDDSYCKPKSNSTCRSWHRFLEINWSGKLNYSSRLMFFLMYVDDLHCVTVNESNGRWEGIRGSGPVILFRGPKYINPAMIFCQHDRMYFVPD